MERERKGILLVKRGKEGVERKKMVLVNEKGRKLEADGKGVKCGWRMCVCGGRDK